MHALDKAEALVDAIREHDWNDSVGLAWEYLIGEGAIGDLGCFNGSSTLSRATGVDARHEKPRLDSCPVIHSFVAVRVWNPWIPVSMACLEDYFEVLKEVESSRFYRGIREIPEDVLGSAFHTGGDDVLLENGGKPMTGRWRINSNFAQAL